MDNDDLISIEFLRQLLRYEVSTGILFWRERPACLFKETDYKGAVRSREWAANNWNSRRSGSEAGANSNGYRAVQINGINYKSHRLAWAIFFGEWPCGQIDHINHDRSDNRIENLRVVDQLANMKNMSASKSNTSSITGVYWNKAANKWQAYIRGDGRYVYLGIYEDIEDAAMARKLAEVKYGYHRNHGQKAV